MKVKRFVTLIGVILIVLTLVLTLFPYSYITYRESNLKQNPESKGAVYYYTFSYSVTIPGSNSDSISVLPLFLGGASGSILIHMESKVAHFNIEINAYQQPTFYNNFTMPFTNSFVENFFNTETHDKGAFVSIQNETGEVEGNVLNTFGYFRNSYAGTNKTLRSYYGSSFDTIPFAIVFNQYNPKYSTESPYSDFNTYDYHDGINVMVGSFLGGYSQYLAGIINRSVVYHNKTQTNYTISQFILQLTTTNVALNPIAVVHYLKTYLPIVIILWVILLPSAYFTIVHRKRRIRRK